MAKGTAKTQRKKKQVPAADPALRPWFQSYHARKLLFELIRDEVARLPAKDQLRVLAQIDSLREDLAEIVKAGV